MFPYYLLFVNLLAFSMMGIDKARAKRDAWRISEKTLFFAAVVGGSPGAMIGMYLFRHKTRHKAFTLGMPAIFLIQVMAIGLQFILQ